MNVKIFDAWHFTTALFFALVIGAYSQQEVGVGLTADEISTVKQTIGYKDTEASKDVKERRVLAAMSLCTDNAKYATPNKVVDVLIFRYSDGITEKYIFDLTNKTVISAEEKGSYPAPLTAAEIEEAKKLAAAKVNEVRDLVAGGDSTYSVRQPMATIYSDRSHEFFRGRTVRLTFEKKAPAPAVIAVVVDLRKQEVIMLK